MLGSRVLITPTQADFASRAQQLAAVLYLEERGADLDDCGFIARRRCASVVLAPAAGSERGQGDCRKSKGDA